MNRPHVRSYRPDLPLRQNARWGYVRGQGFVIVRVSRDVARYADRMIAFITRRGDPDNFRWIEKVRE